MNGGSGTTEELVLRRQATELKARLHAEAAIQRARWWGLGVGAVQTAIYGGTRSWVNWAALLLVLINAISVHRGLRRPSAGRSVRTIGAVAMTADTIAVSALMFNLVGHPEDPIQMLPVLLAAEAAVRWGRTGGVAMGALAGTISSVWSVAAHHQAGTHQPFASISFRFAIIVLVGALLGTTVRHANQQRRTAEAISNASTDLIASYDLNGRILWINPACEQVLGYPAEALIGRPGRDLVHPDDRPPDRSPMADSDTARVEQRFLRSDGEVVWLELSLQSDRDQGVVHAIGRDVTDRRQVEQDLRHRVERDDLTGAATRSALLERLDGALSRPGGLALLFIDVDRFKAVNDTYGHLTGDQVLVEVVQRINHQIRIADLVARFAGDEFCVLLSDREPPVDADGAARRVAQALAEPFELEAGLVRLTASVGVAERRPTDTSADLLRRADRAMYDIKHTTSINRVS